MNTPTRRSIESLFLAAALLSGPAAWAQSNGGASPAPAHPASVATAPTDAAPAFSLADAVVIGASVSAGAEVSLPGLPPTVLEGHCNLADVLGATLGPTAIVLPKAPGARARINALAPRNLASWRFFESPDAMAERQLSAVKTAGTTPGIVFALDYLFWHAYGGGLSDEVRRKQFQKGLDRLASLPRTTTIVVADLPDMTHAIGLMLSKPMVPPVALQEELNKSLAEWAAKPEHANVVLVPLRETVASSWASKPVRLGGVVYDGEAARTLLTNSGLHATAGGLIALAQEALDRLKAAGKLPEGVTWERDRAVVMQRLVDGKKAAEEAKKAAAKAATEPKPAAPAVEPGAPK